MKTLDLLGASIRARLIRAAYLTKESRIRRNQACSYLRGSLEIKSDEDRYDDLTEKFGCLLI